MRCSNVSLKEAQVSLYIEGESFGSITNPLRKIQVIQLAIESNIEIHFGIRPGLLSDHLLKSVMGDIAKKFPDLCAEDITFAFDRFIFEKRDTWKNVTKREIMEPIFNWWNKKKAVHVEYGKFRTAAEAEAGAQQKADEFERESLEYYRSALKDGLWIGDMFNAHSIAKKFIAEHIDQEIKDELWKEAKFKLREGKAIAEAGLEHKHEMNLTPEMLGVSALKIFAELIVEKGIELKIEI